MLTALRWTRRTLDALLVVAVLVVVATAGITLLAPVLGGRALVIGGGSMDPAIGRGALVLALPQPAGYAVGDVVTVQQGTATPYTHRIKRLAALDGVPYVETKGDANEKPDPAIVPVAAILGRVAFAIPLLGYVSVVLGSALGLAGFLALCATVLLLIWILEDQEEQRCLVCAAGAGLAGAAGTAPGAAAEGTAPDPTHGAHAGPAGTATAIGLAGAAGSLSILPALARAPERACVRESGRARDPRTPVLLEADRRNPRRHGRVTTPTPAVGSSPGAADAGSPGGATVAPTDAERAA